MGLIFTPNLHPGEFQLAIDSLTLRAPPRAYSHEVGWFKSAELKEKLANSLDREFSNGKTFVEQAGCAGGEIVLSDGAVTNGDRPTIGILENGDGSVSVVWCDGRRDWLMPVHSVNEGRQIVMEALWGTTIVRAGFVVGVDEYCIEGIKKARKKYSCDAPLRAVRWDDNVSPMTGDAVCDGYSDDCASVINPGDLYVCLLLTDRDTIDATGSYWNTHRICIPCALSEWIIVKDERRVVP